MGLGWRRELVRGRAGKLRLAKEVGRKRTANNTSTPFALGLELPKEDERGDWEQGLIKGWPCWSLCSPGP